MFVATLRYQAAAEQAQRKAAIQAEGAAAREELAQQAADQARDTAAKDAAPAEAKPLEQVNNAFRAAYKSARQDALAAASPVVVVAGDDLVLIRAGKRSSVKVVPPQYHDLKAFSHVPLAAYLLTRRGFNDDRRMHRDLLSDAATEILKGMKR